MTPSLYKKTQPFFRLSLPILPPSVNATYQVVRDRQGRSRLALTKKGKQFKKDAPVLLSQAKIQWDIVYAIRQAVEAAQRDIQAEESMPRLALSLQFFFETDKRDIDGGIKILQDVLSDHLQLDDVHVVKLCVEKYVDPANPRVEIEVSLVEEVA